MKTWESTVSILGIGTALPPYRIDQDETAGKLAEALADRRDAARWARKIFKSCGVETRYTCEPNLLEPIDRCRYLSNRPQADIPATGERMEMYKRQSVPLAGEAAAEALRDGNVEPARITHLITVSCTGLFLPGIDVALMQALGLDANVSRIPLTFMGCAAGLTAIRLSEQIVRGNPASKVLIVCVELCTLHMQPSSAREALYATAFFGDGASACIVGEASPGQRAIFALSKGETVLFPGSTGDMVWNVGNYGFDLFLSPHIPKLIGEFVPAEIARFLKGRAAPELWAIHPGGRGIVDTLQSALSLTDAQTRASRSVLREYGNMSSATLLFVLQRMRQWLEAERQGPKEGMALAFGPGLTAELMNIAYVPAGSPYPEALDDAYV
ncbi:type III polyketide synthase [Paenibacillus sp. CECT 9249]|uniref:type III polyketide synthase n=1 Tax=Paenibacillus sp. CECT 9249 TaxID=2845385 RepID=UPI0033B3B123